MQPREFTVKLEEFTFNAKIEVGLESLWAKLSGVQFPIISNSATTGHKLQGFTAKALLASNWHYGQNWPHVVMSRVRTQDKLHMLEKLSRDLTKYEMNPDMLAMLQEFRDACSLLWLDDDWYETEMQKEEADTT